VLVDQYPGICLFPGCLKWDRIIARGAELLKGNFVEEHNPVTGVYYLKSHSLWAKLTFLLQFNSH